MSYEATTRDIRVVVTPQFEPDMSAPEARAWIWSYAVEITNQGKVPVQLVARHWVITDGVGVVEQVRGPGVVGEQPRILPGATHRYRSMCPLKTSMGKMEGSYQMVLDDGTSFEAEIPPFALVVEELLN